MPACRQCGLRISAEEADKVSCEEATSKSMFKVEGYVYLRMQCANTKQYEFDYFLKCQRDSK